MSEQLRRHPDELDALVAQTAAAQGLPAPYVEKDFWSPRSCALPPSIEK